MLERARGSAPADALPALKKADRLARRGRALDADTGTCADALLRSFRAACDRKKDATVDVTQALMADEARVSAALRAVAESPRFREALAWQNRAALETAVAPLLRNRESALGSKERQHEELVASYLHRYCAKNDTIGFFGPVGWARVVGDAERRVDVVPGPSLLSGRSVHFEQWAIDEIARTIAREPGIREWMSPRRLPFIVRDGHTARSVVTGAHELSHKEWVVLAASNGTHHARDLASALQAEHPDLFRDVADVFTVLEALREKQLVAWTIEVPLTWDPDARLGRILDGIADDTIRADASRPLHELVAARRGVEAAAGQPDALLLAFQHLEEVFTRLTGVPPTRHAGSMYAARQLVFEDCRRDVDVALGGAFLEEIGPALSLVLTSARWMTAEAARVCRAKFRKIYDDVIRRTRRQRASLLDVWSQMQGALLGDRVSLLAAVKEEVQRRWAEILGAREGERRVVRSSSDLALRVREAFAAPRPGWSRARHHSPDVMIAAPSIDHICRGEYEGVLGEIHVGANTMDLAFMVAQHPRPEELMGAYARDMPEGVAMSVYSKEFLRITVRTNRAFVPPSAVFVESGFDIADVPRDRVLAIADLEIEDAGGDLFVCGRNGFRMEIIEFFGDNMSLLTMNAFHLLPVAPHSGRVTIDKLVVARETWNVPASSLQFAFESTRDARFMGAQRWARELGVPRYFFAKSPFEVKPNFVDLESPTAVNLFTKVVRRAHKRAEGTTVTVSEMLPNLKDAWLFDREGNSYVSEIRVVIVDEET